MSSLLKLFQRVVGPDRLDSGETLRAEYFPAAARGRDIITVDGAIIATAADPMLAAGSLAQSLSASLEALRVADLSDAAAGLHDHAM
jgi:hypothetical protein